MSRPRTEAYGVPPAENKIENGQVQAIRWQNK